jgi:hypothetical protein
MQEKIIVQPYYLIYVDFLGIKEYMKSKDSNIWIKRLNDIYGELNNFIDQRIEIYKNLGYSLNGQYFKIDSIDIKRKIFSDNFIIAIPKDNGDDISESIKHTLVVEIASFVQCISCKYGLLIRGSISIGDLFINEDFVCGKALVDAYYLENKFAIYPRIVINEQDANLLLNSNENLKYLVQYDYDIFYIKAFDCYYSISKIYKQEEIKTIKDFIHQEIQKDYPDKIKQKIDWINNQFSKFCSKNNL